MRIFRLKHLKQVIDHYIFKIGLTQLNDILLEQHLTNLKSVSTNPLNQKGYAVFSQFDEDGILAEILERLGISEGQFLEMGVGDGTENNTLNLIANGWSGLWIGGQSLINSNFSQSDKLKFIKAWITAENVAELIQSNMVGRIEHFDLISIDLDGNDHEIWKQVLSKWKAKVIVAEYNGRFDSQTKWSMPYNPSNIWQRDCYFGASFRSLVILFEFFGYSVVATSLNGTNLFLVSNDYVSKFADVPRSLDEIYNPARNFLFKNRYRVGISLFNSITGNSLTDTSI